MKPTSPLLTAAFALALAAGSAGIGPSPQAITVIEEKTMKPTSPLLTAAFAFALAAGPAAADEASGGTGPRVLDPSEMDRVAAGTGDLHVRIAPFFGGPLTDFRHNLITSPGYKAAQAAMISRRFLPNSPYANSPNAPAHYRNTIAAWYNRAMAATANLGARIFANPAYW